MTALVSSLADWQTDAFSQTLKQELLRLPSGTLPLAQALDAGGLVDDSNMEISILSVSDDENTIMVRTGVFFAEIIICCGCGDDPFPQNVYCQMLVSINKSTAEAGFAIIPDPE